MLPVLELVSGGQEYKFRDLIERLAIKFQVSDQERKELLPSGAAAIFDNRATLSPNWDRTFLGRNLGALTQNICGSSPDL
jgi:restriction system protein